MIIAPDLVFVSSGNNRSRPLVNQSRDSHNCSSWVAAANVPLLNMRVTVFDHELATSVDLTSASAEVPNLLCYGCLMVAKGPWFSDHQVGFLLMSGISKFQVFSKLVLKIYFIIEKLINKLYPFYLQKRSHGSSGAVGGKDG